MAPDTGSKAAAAGDQVMNLGGETVAPAAAMTDLAAPAGGDPGGAATMRPAGTASLGTAIVERNALSARVATAADVIPGVRSRCRIRTSRLRSMAGLAAQAARGGAAGPREAAVRPVARAVASATPSTAPILPPIAAATVALALVPNRLVGLPNRPRPKPAGPKATVPSRPGDPPVLGPMAVAAERRAVGPVLDVWGRR